MEETPDHDVPPVTSKESGEAPVPFENEASTPNSPGPEGAGGRMGVSSERTGPDGPDPRGLGAPGSVEGMGTKGTARTRTDGELDVTPGAWDAADVSQRDLAEHERPDADAENRGGTPWDVDEPQPAPIADEKLRRET
ncbi:hypothetical protein G7072_07060 [Nocardioides sp. HDW12B]|uniref:hypothetical protein n=1 Tax=Nocardioides sp. HDW12B TaxID=2714939 RepID=UPI00140D2E67|nr:hypothetical protein [Nocardioides sp. HDW12B]QIK66134.1 hypothetical protein G7072_07060 [Nocardioides sp. HDW12B]